MLLGSELALRCSIVSLALIVMLCSQARPAAGQEQPTVARDSVQVNAFTFNVYRGSFDTWSWVPRMEFSVRGPIGYVFLTPADVGGWQRPTLNVAFWARGDYNGSFQPHLFYKGQEVGKLSFEGLGDGSALAAPGRASASRATEGARRWSRTIRFSARPGARPPVLTGASCQSSSRPSSHRLSCTEPGPFALHRATSGRL
jgi:hypothetical protein